jgi:hypothetical protein
MVLDFAVASAVYRARQIERALHDSGPWTMTWGPHEVPACRLVGESSIKFLGHFPEHCFLVAPDPALTLKCRGEVVGTRAIEFPGDGEFGVEWELALAAPATV